jgi:ferredoxin
MLFYFSGTGNSAWVAQNVANGIGDERVYSIPSETFSFKLSEGEPLGFVFPCYAWGVPCFVETFIKNLQIENVSYVYFVVTCGDDTGRTSEMFLDLIATKGWSCSLGYAVQMPESYVNLPGFDVDSDEKAMRKIVVANERIRQIVLDIKNNRKGYYDTLPGRFKWVKSCVVRPFFNKYLISPEPFKVNSDCSVCGKCVSVCPFDNICISEQTKRPKWNDKCVLCMRCYHSCPNHAIHWGCFTKNKGQYLFSKYSSARKGKE